MIDLLIHQEEIVLQPEPRRYLYRGKEYRSLTDRIQDSGLGDDFSKVPAPILKRACQRGTAVHMACHYYDDEDLDMDSVDEAIKGYVSGYVKFDTECPGKNVAVEKKLVAPILCGPITIIMGVTPDLVRFVRGRRSIIERKTSQHLGPGARIQTAGQRRAWNALFPNQPVYDRYGLRLQPDGNYKLIPHEDPDDDVAFEDALLYSFAKERRDRWLQKYSKLTRGDNHAINATSHNGT